MSACAPRARARAICRCAASTLFVGFKLRLERSKLCERRIRIRLPALLLRIAPLARLGPSAIAVLEVAPSLTRPAILTIAIWTVAAAALAWRRTAFALFGFIGAFAAFASRMTRALVLPVRPCLARRRTGRCVGCGDRCAVA